MARSNQVGSSCPNCGNVLKQKIKRGPKPQFAGYTGLASGKCIRAFKYGWIGCLLVIAGCFSVGKLFQMTMGGASIHEAAIAADSTDDPAYERWESFQLERGNLFAVLTPIALLALLGAFLCIIFHLICRRSRKQASRAYRATVAYWETGGLTGDSPPSTSGNTRRVFGVVRNVDSDSSGGGDFSGMG
jgi:hypothetical protein